MTHQLCFVNQYQDPLMMFVLYYVRYVYKYAPPSCVAQETWVEAKVGKVPIYEASSSFRTDIIS